MQFAHPELLWLLTVIVPLIVWYVIKHRNAWPAMSMSTLAPFEGMRRSWRGATRHIVFILTLGAIASSIVALARPQTHEAWHHTSIFGTDIVLAIDVSPSMNAIDDMSGRVNRLDAIKSVAEKFIEKRNHDNMGIVIFAGEALTGLPLTNDRGALTAYVQSLRVGMLGDLTAIGDGIATAVNRLKEGKAKSKSIVLLTDGSSNKGILLPQQAAEIARQLNIKIYTVGIGSNGYALYPVEDRFGRVSMQRVEVEFDEKTLRDVAQTTGGQYYRATDSQTLSNIFEQIDALEKTELDTKQFTQTDDQYMLWALIAAGCLFAAILLRNTLYRTIP